VDSLVGNVQMSLIRAASLRLDFGFERIFPTASLGAVVGVGASLKWRLSDSIAITSGRPYSFAFCSGPGGGPIFRTDDLFVYADSSFRPFFGPRFSGSLWTLGLPVGVIVQLAQPLTVTLRSGFRVGNDGVADFTAIPLGFDILVRALTSL